jgi:hypothetical protein
MSSPAKVIVPLPAVISPVQVRAADVSVAAEAAAAKLAKQAATAKMALRNDLCIYSNGFVAYFLANDEVRAKSEQRKCLTYLYV